jgi:hypothetical protein
MISAFLRREFSSLLNPVSKLRLSSFEFSGLVIGCDPVGNLFFDLRANVSFLLCEAGSHRLRNVYHFC